MKEIMMNHDKLFKKSTKCKEGGDNPKMKKRRVKKMRKRMKRIKK